MSTQDKGSPNTSHYYKSAPLRNLGYTAGVLLPNQNPKSSRKTCPFEEFERIRKNNTILASTGCTSEFCQAGRAIHTNESRVGCNRPIAEIIEDASAFLTDLRKANIIKTDEDLAQRLSDVLQQIGASATYTSTVSSNGSEQELAGGTWIQTHDELEYGLQVAWKNSRKCIMRSQYKELRLCDLRHIKNSTEMGTSLVEATTKAFNQGNIQPTVFVFPPREVDSRGPMIWNHQILSFAGYQQPDGTILGDPLNVSLTEAIINLGWKPPSQESRTPWDILPLVTMAQNDSPAIIELPPELKQLVQIRHPQYSEEFKDLGLKWVPFPALSRLGFDIGGVQYTATPFIGWFMDAEIGVRNLADTFRYNTLPKIAKKLRLYTNPELEIDDLPEYERLAALSRAQTELNFAVYWSFLQSRVSMSDSLTASVMWSQFDDQHKHEYGYRLPADPYWLAPPQGSIIPLWHRGGAPNYQPKPLICRHMQDPIKAYLRESETRLNGFSKQDHLGPLILLEKPVAQQANLVQEKSVRLFHCSSGVIAHKLALKLYSRLSTHTQEIAHLGRLQPPQSLNELNLTEINANDTLFFIISTTGQGEIPSNGNKFFIQHRDLKTVHPINYSIFGNGDSTYLDTFNAAAFEIDSFLANVGCCQILDGVFIGDNTVESPPWTFFESWWAQIRSVVLRMNTGMIKMDQKVKNYEPLRVFSFPQASLAFQVKKRSGVTIVSLNIGNSSYQEMGNIKILPPNSSTKVERALASLRTGREFILATCGGLTAYQYLRECVDLDLPFKDLQWTSDEIGFTKTEIDRLSILDALEVITSDHLPSNLERVFQAMSAIRPRVFSVASSPNFTAPNQVKSLGNVVDLLVKIHPTGRFSNAFLSESQTGDTMRYQFSPSLAWGLFNSPKPRPVIALAIGSGLAPIRSLIQKRVADIQWASPGTNPYQNTRISLFIGFKPWDNDIVNNCVSDASRLGLFDILELVPSNTEKIRPQDKLLDKKNKPVLCSKLQDPRCVVFVCANNAAATETSTKLSILTNQNIKQALGDRYIEEAYS